MCLNVRWWIMSSNECWNGWFSFPLETSIHQVCLVGRWCITSSNECLGGWVSFSLKNEILWTPMVVCWWIMSFNGILRLNEFHSHGKPKFFEHLLLSIDELQPPMNVKMDEFHSP
jgi:hypothetical protein